MNVPVARTTRGAPTAGRGLREPWTLVASVVVLLSALWIQTPRSSVAALLTGALLALGVLTWRSRSAFWRRGAFLTTAALLVVMAARFHATLAGLEQDGEAQRAALAAEGGKQLVAAFADEVAVLARVARVALEVPAVIADAYTALGILLPPGGDRAVVLVRGGRPVAWAGRLLVPLDSLPAPTGLVATPLYLVAYAVATRGSDVAVAASLLHAEPPADRLSAPLDERVAAAAGVQGFLYAEPAAAAGIAEAVVLRMDDRPVLAARAAVASVEGLRVEAWDRLLPRAGGALAVLVLLLITIAWRRDTGLAPRLSALAVAFAALAILPLSAFSNVSALFDPSFYVVRDGWRFTANAGALAITSALLLLALLSARRARVRFRSRAQAIAAVVIVAGLAPFLLRELARGIEVPNIGASASLWISWEVTIFLATVTVLLLGVTAGQGAVARARGLPVWVAPGIAVLAMFAAPPLLEAPGLLPKLYTGLWVLAIAALALTHRARATVLPVALVAACGAVTLVWFSAVRDRVGLAARDVQGLTVASRDAAVLLDRYAAVLDPARAARTRVELLSQFARSELAVAEFPTEIATWASDGALMGELAVGRAPGATYGVNLFAYEVQQTRQPAITEVRGDPGIHLVLSVPHADGTATTVVVAPRTRLLAMDPFGAFLGFSPPPAPEPPYALRLGELGTASPVAPTGRGHWVREGDELHGDWELTSVGGLSRRVHADVDLRPPDVLLTRGTLLVLLDLGVLGALWMLMVTADGALPRWWRLRRGEILTSYRTRLTGALFLCFLVPSLLFGLWSFRRLQADDQQARDLLVRETLRGIATSTDSVQLAEAAARFETPLFLYADGLLIGTSDPLLDALAPVGRLLPPSVMATLAEGDEVTTGRKEDIGPATVRLGYRAATDASGVQYVLAAPARLDERLLDRRRNDLATFLLFALAMGAIGALLASGAASRQLSRPIRELRDSALALARGDRVPTLREDPPLEFTPVFTAFRQMTTDLAESRTALEAAERQLAATLRNVASGVVALDADGAVTFVNPRAIAILDAAIEVGRKLPSPILALLGGVVADFQSGDADEGAVELEHDGRRLNVRLARLAPSSRRTVVTLDDVTEVTRAERVLAWGEMARQVAHEIKNPLTPMRLGLQHLRRARKDPRVDFDRVLDENTARMLAEIDRLDEIARAFSRYGTAPVAEAPAEAVDVTLAARAVLELEQMGEAAVRWEGHIPDGPLLAAARDRELREVLLNLLENARLARATTVRMEVEALADGTVEIRVRDDGTGIADHLVTRIFEPHFSTRTSGSGLGLAISRRLIDGWGGSITAESTPGAGSLFRVRLAPARRD